MKHAWLFILVWFALFANTAVAQTTRCGVELGKWVCRTDQGVPQQPFQFADIPKAFNEGREAALRQQLLEEQVRQARLATQQMQEAATPQTASPQYVPNSAGLSPRSPEEVAYNQTLNVSEARAKSVHGGAVVERAKDWFQSLRQAFPEKANAILTASDPYEMLITEYAKVGGK